MLIGSILNPGRGQTPPPHQPQPQPEPQPEPQQTSEPAPPPQTPPAAEPTEPAAEPQPVAASSTPFEPAPPASSSPPPVPAPATSVAAALSANPPARIDYQAIGSWIAQGTVPVATAASAVVPAPIRAAEAAEGATRDVILRDAWASVLAQANVTRADVIELLR